MAGVLVQLYSVRKRWRRRRHIIYNNNNYTRANTDSRLSHARAQTRSASRRRINHMYLYNARRTQYYYHLFPPPQTQHLSRPSSRRSKFVTTTYIIYIVSHTHTHTHIYIPVYVYRIASLRVPRAL
jgi:hypothetical protein